MRLCLHQNNIGIRIIDKGETPAGAHISGAGFFTDNRLAERREANLIGVPLPAIWI